MSNGNDKQQQGQQQGAGPIKVKALYFLALEGVMCRALRSCDGKMHELQAGTRKTWTTEIVREPWHRMYRVTETEENPDGRWDKVRVCLIPESAASYVPEVP